jgi:alpha/beta superfamily hydrolase
MSDFCVVFSHGQDGEPWGTKIVVLAEVARERGLAVESVDYRGMADPQVRVERLRSVCRELARPVLLVGSSLGGHVATAVAAEVAARGLFLMAPAFYMPGFERYTPSPPPCPMCIVHGWRDDVVPVEHSWRYASACRAELHILDSDHRLTAQLPEIRTLFADFLQRVGNP